MYSTYPGSGQNDAATAIAVGPGGKHSVTGVAGGGDVSRAGSPRPSGTGDGWSFRGQAQTTLGPDTDLSPRVVAEDLTRLVGQVAHDHLARRPGQPGPTLLDDRLPARGLSKRATAGVPPTDPAIPRARGPARPYSPLDALAKLNGHTVSFRREQRRGGTRT